MTRRREYPLGPNYYLPLSPRPHLFSPPGVRRPTQEAPLMAGRRRGGGGGGGQCCDDRKIRNSATGSMSTLTGLLQKIRAEEEGMRFYMLECFTRQWCPLFGPHMAQKRVVPHPGVAKVTCRKPHFWPLVDDPFWIPKRGISRGFGAKWGVKTATNSFETGSDCVFEHPK